MVEMVVSNNGSFVTTNDTEPIVMQLQSPCIIERVLRMDGYTSYQLVKSFP